LINWLINWYISKAEQKKHLIVVDRWDVEEIETNFHAQCIFLLLFYSLIINNTYTFTCLIYPAIWQVYITFTFCIKLLLNYFFKKTFQLRHFARKRYRYDVLAVCFRLNIINNAIQNYNFIQNSYMSKLRTICFASRIKAIDCIKCVHVWNNFFYFYLLKV